MKYKLVTVKNPFNPADRDIVEREAVSGETLKALPLPDGVDFRVVLNGEIIENDNLDKTYICDGDFITLVPVPAGGGGGGGKDVIRTVATIAITAAAMYALGPNGAGLTGAWLYAGVAAASIAGGYLVNALMPPATADVPTLDGFGYDKSNFYSWNPQTTQQQGASIPRFYGKNKLVGNIIAAYIENKNDTQYLNVLISLGIGQFESIRDIMLNDQPIESFSDVEVYTRLGLINQDVIPNFNDTKTEQTTSVKVSYSNPYTYITNTSGFDQVEVDISFSRGLYYANDQGGLSSVTVKLTIETRPVGGEWSEPITLSVTAAKQSTVSRTTTIDTPADSKYEIRITRLTADHTSSRYASDFWLTAVREVYLEDFIYPRQVLVGLRALATDQLSGSLRFSCVAECLKIRVYDGESWNLEYNNNPAWVAFNIATLPVCADDGTVSRYDRLDPSRLDLESFIEWAEFCDELVTDGKGGYEPRCSFNGGWDAETTLWEALLQVCECGRAMLVLSGTKIRVVIDRTDEASQLFSVGNMTLSKFSGHYMAMSDRVASLELDFKNAELDYERDRIRIADPDAEGETGSIQLFGITSPAQAWRDAVLRLNKNRLLREYCEFSVDIEALASTVGDVILVQHDVPRWGEGGRIISADESTIQLDKLVTMDSAKSYTLILRMNDDSVVTRSVVTVAGETDTVTVATVLPSIPDKYTLYAFGESEKVVKKFRILEIARDGKEQHRLSCIEYNADIYNDAVVDVSSSVSSSSLAALGTVLNLQLQERTEKATDGTVYTYIDVYYTKPRESVAKLFNIYVDAGAGFVFIGSTEDTYYKFVSPVEGANITVAVAVTDILGRKQSVSEAKKATIYVYGKVAGVSNVVDIWASPSMGGLRLDWSAVPDTDLGHYEVRYSNNTSAPWAQCAVLAQHVKVTTFYIPSASSGLYLVKAVDTSGNKSSVAASVISAIPAVSTYIELDSFTEDGFTGDKVGFYINGGLLISGAAGAFDDIEDLDAVVDLDRFGGALEESFYTCANSIDLASAAAVRLITEITAEAYALEEIFDNIEDLDAIENIDAEPDDVQTYTYVAISGDGVTYGDYALFSGGDLFGQSFKIKIKTVCGSRAHWAEISQISVRAVMPERFERGDDVICPPTGLTVTYDAEFNRKPRVGVTIQDAAVGDTFRIITSTASGFTVQVSDITGTAKEASIDWWAQGI